MRIYAASESCDFVRAEVRIRDASRINVGCGQTPTHDWKNYDNSWTARLGRRRFVSFLVGRLGLLSQAQREFLGVVRREGIRWANAVRRIPEPDGSADVVYSSHMVEHLRREDARRFLAEAYRVLKPGGVLRLAVPDLRYHVTNYLQDGDADHLIEATLLTRPKPTGFSEKLRSWWTGDRHHQWMYDGTSLCRLVSAAGFADAGVVGAGTTRISQPGPLNLSERSPESVYVEAIRP